MWPVPKNASSASRSPSAATVFRRRVSLRPRRFVRFAAMNFIDREFEFLQEIGPDRALRVRVAAGRSLHVRFDRFPLISHELREAGEGLHFSFLSLRELRSDALAMIDWHLFSSPVHRHELDVCPGIDHWRELREVEPVPLSQPFDEDILFLLEFVEGADGLAEVVFRSDRLAHPSFRQLNHGGVQEVAAVAEVLGFEERRAYRRAVATRSLETGLDYEDLVRARHQFALLRKDFPVFHDRETVREGPRLHREQPLLHDGAVVEQERAEPCRQEEHRAGRNGSVRKSVSAYRDLARAFFFGAARPDGRSWEGFRIPRSVMIPVMYLAGVTSNDGLRAGLSFGAMGCPSRWRTSCGDRSSIGILAPDAKAVSIVLVGAAT